MLHRVQTFSCTCLALVLQICTPVFARDDIHSAVRRNDGPAVRALVQADPSVLRDKSTSQTPLHEAACYGSADMVKLLLDLGADVNAIAYNDFTPLHVANSADTVKLLVRSGADSSKRDSWGMTPLQAAAESDRVGVADAMIEAGVKLDLVSALRLKKRDAAKKLLQEDPNAARPTERNASLFGNASPLGIAAGQGDLELVQLLVQAGADVNHLTDMPNAGAAATPLANAVWGGHVAVVRFLLGHNAVTTSAGGKFYGSLFDYAIQNSPLEIVELLLSHGALDEDCQVGYAMRRSPLSSASGAGELDKVKLLIKHGPTCFNDEDKRRAMFVAALEGRAEVVRLFQENGILPDLFTSAVLGDAQEMRRQLDADASLANAQDGLLHRSLLSWAIAARQKEMALLLIERGADPNKATVRPVTYGVLYEGARKPGFQGVGGYATATETPLTVATLDDESGRNRPPDRDLVHLLLEKGANPNVVGMFDQTPLAAAIGAADVALVEDLLAHGANANAKVHETPLLLVSLHSKEVAAKLLEYGADPNATTPSGTSALDEALRYPGNQVGELLARKARITLLAACALGRVDMVREELERDPKRVDAPLPGTSKTTPLMVAAQHSQIEVARYLLDKDASLAITDDRGLTPLHYAAQAGSTAVAQLLLERGAKVTHESGQGTPLHRAAMYGKRDTVQLLLDRGADVNAMANVTGWTPLHAVASWSDDAPVAELLLARGAELNRSRADSGETALHAAAQSGSVKVTRVLLARGADISIRDSRGKTPLDWALWNNGFEDPDRTARKADVAKLLRERANK